MKRLFLALACLALALTSPSWAAITVSSEFGSGLVRDDARNEFDEEVLTNGFQADIGETGFAIDVSNSIEIGEGDRGFERGGNNQNNYGVTFEKEIDEEYSWGTGASYRDYLARESDDEWSLGIWGQFDFNDSVGVCLSIDQIFETASGAAPAGYSEVTLSVPMTFELSEELSVPVEPSVSYSEGSTPLDASFVAGCDTGLDWQVNENFLWSIAKVTVAGVIEHVHDERNGKVEVAYSTAVSYTF